MPPDISELPGVSVIICTRDRPARVRECLAALRVAGETCPDLLFEVLVIENGSSASCLLDEKEIRRIAPSATRLIKLADGGLSMARNFGMMNARGILWAFVDDDCLVDPAWLCDVYRHWQTMRGDFLLGGRVRLADPEDIAFTIKDVSEAQVFHEGVHPGGFIQGCNFIVPRTTAQRIGDFDLRFGAGARFRAGEDTDFIIRAHGLGVPVHYKPDMLVLHRHGRRSFAEIDRLNRSYAHANGAILAKHLFQHPWLAKHLLWTIRSGMREKIGGPRFNDQIGLHWQSVVRAQIAGFAAYVGSSLRLLRRLS